MPRNDLTSEQQAAIERAEEEPRSGDVDDLRTLGMLLTYSEPAIRRLGLDAMSAILEEAPSLELDARAESLLSLLADALDDDVAGVRTAAAVVTVRLATEAPTQASAAVGLLQELLDAESPRVRNKATKGLSVLAVDAPDAAAVTAIEALADQIDVEPERTGSALGERLVTVARAAPERQSVVARTLEPTPSRGWTESTRTDCLDALGTLGTIDETAAREVRRRLRPALADESPAVRRTAVEALGTSATAAPEHVPPVLRTLRPMLLDEATDVCTEAVTALGEIAATDAVGATTALATLGTIVESNPADEVRRMAGATLATIEVRTLDDQEGARPFSRRTGPPTPTIGAVATDRIADADIVGALSAALSDDHHDVRTYAAEGLAGVAAAAPEQAVPAVEPLGDSLASAVRDGDATNPSTVEDPMDPQRPLAAAVASALRRITAEHPRAVAPIVDALVTAFDADDKITISDAVRAIECLGEAAPERVGPAIKPLSRLAEQPPTESLEETAREALTTIGNAEPAPRGRSSVPAAARERLGAPKQVWQTLVRRPVPGGLAVTGERVCVATSDGDLLGVDADSGESEWRRELEPAEPSAVVANAGLFIVSCRDGRVLAAAPDSGATQWVFAPNDRTALDTRIAAAGGTVAVWNGTGVLYGIDATEGTVRWRSAFDHDGKAFPTVADDTLYLGTGDGRLVALDASSGTKKWRHDLGEPVGSAPAYAGGTVSLGTLAGTLVALAGDDGTSRWRMEFDVAVDVSPAVADGAVYVGCGAADHLQALDAPTGEPRWRMQPGGQVVSQPAVSTTGVYVGTNEGVYAVNAEDGEQRWSLGTDGTAVVGPTVSDGTVYTATWDGSLYALAEAGGERGSESGSR